MLHTKGDLLKKLVRFWKLIARIKEVGVLKTCNIVALTWMRLVDSFVWPRWVIIVAFHVSCKSLKDSEI